MAASKQASKHTHVHNAVTLVWGSLRLAPINSFARLSLATPYSATGRTKHG